MNCYREKGQSLTVRSAPGFTGGQPQREKTQWGPPASMARITSLVRAYCAFGSNYSAAKLLSPAAIHAAGGLQALSKWTGPPGPLPI